eukprot:gene8166-16785_t
MHLGELSEMPYQQNKLVKTIIDRKNVASGLKGLSIINKKIVGQNTNNMWRCSSSSNEGLVTSLRDAGILKSEKAISAMKSVDRKNYARENPYADSPQPIGFGQTISAPHMHATVLEDLAHQIQRPDSRILDVGCGSGYLTAVF